MLALSSSRVMKRSVVWSVAFLSHLVLLAGRSFAWIYPEHRDITLLAVQKLDPERRAIFGRLWAEARADHAKRLCEQPADATQAEKPSCIGWAAWPAIAGDHSCSAEDMVHTILTTRWILDVANIAAVLKQDLADAKDRSQHINALRNSDIRLQRADEEYGTRAGANNVHFLLARSSVDEESLDYITRSLQEGAELNALGAYAWYHLSALEKASRLSRESLRPEQRSALALAVLADEAFALHFLEDAYAAGHVAGTWGSASLRKGTHDYYNEHGLEARQWEGKSIVLTGDAYMRPQDAERAAEAIRTSLEQILDAASGRGPVAGIPYDPAMALLPDAFNVCTLITMPARTAHPSVDPLFVAVIEDVPVSGLEPGPGELPRFRAELGPFIGFSAGGGVRGVNGGFGTTQSTAGAIGNMEAAVRLGFGLEGVLKEAGDGLVSLDLGVRLDSASSMDNSDDPTLAITDAIPSRSALTARLRMPFWLIPGDLLLASPLLAISPDTYTKMAVVASNGGLIPWQTGIATPLGRFQFVLGREVGVSFYGFLGDDDRFIIPQTGAGTGDTLVDLSSISFDFPILEYRPFRTFSQDQTAGLLVQLYTGFEFPTSVSVVAPVGAPEPDVETIFHVGLRVTFDWRYYF